MWLLICWRRGCLCLCALTLETPPGAAQGENNGRNNPKAREWVWNGDFAACVNGFLFWKISKIFMLVMFCFMTACMHLLSTTEYIWPSCTFKVLIESMVTISYFQASCMLDIVRKCLNQITVKQVSTVWMCLITHWNNNPKNKKPLEAIEDVFVLHHHELPEAG